MAHTYSADQMDRIRAAVESSPAWKMINNKVKSIYAQYNRIPSDEEYQAVREMILYKTIIEDSNVMQTLSDCTKEVLSQIK